MEAPERAGVLYADKIHILDLISQPIWLYRCSDRRLLWGNKAALELYSRTLNQFTAYTFSFSNSGHEKHYTTQNAVLRDEVELGGRQWLTSGFGHACLPGVIPWPEQGKNDYLYKPCRLALEDGKEVSCTVVQVISTSVVAKRSSYQVKARSRRLSCKHASMPSANTLDDVRTMLDLLESILQDREVDLDCVGHLHKILMHGDIVTQASQIAAQMVNKEDLDQDVGRNLLQLLGSDKQPVAAIDPTESKPSDNGSLISKSASLARAGDTPETLTGETDIIPLHLVPEVDEVLATVDSWRFDAFKLADVTQGHPLSVLAFYLMQRYHIISQFNLDAVKLARFLRTVEEGYPDNPYHNCTHAADVLQGMHVLLTKGGMLRRLNDEVAQLAAYLAAVAHDYEHKGLNNDFLVKVGDDLAMTYNDASPMENHHVSGTFKLMRNPDYNFAAGLPKDKQGRLRKLLIDMVLATDMKQHFNILSKFQAKFQVKLRTHAHPFGNNSCSGTADAGTDDNSPIAEDDADKSLVLQVGLKCADVGHLAAPWEVHHRWVSGLEEEFFRQGDQERALHLPVSPLMDRNKDGITRSQVGFFDIVALPLFYSWATVFPDAVPIVRAVEDNCNRWKVIEAARGTRNN